MLLVNTYYRRSIVMASYYKLNSFGITTSSNSDNTLSCLNEIPHASYDHDKALISCLSNTRGRSQAL